MHPRATWCGEGGHFLSHLQGLGRGVGSRSTVLAQAPASVDRCVPQTRLRRWEGPAGQGSRAGGIPAAALDISGGLVYGLHYRMWGTYSEFHPKVPAQEKQRMEMVLGGWRICKEEY